MLAPNFTETHLAPVDPAEQVDSSVRQAALNFYRLLFSRRRTEAGGFEDDLDRIVAVHFEEDNHPEAFYPEGHVAARGLAGLRAYRAGFDGPDGPPVLTRLETFAVPASRTWKIPGTNQRYDFGALVQFMVLGPNGKPFGVRLREDLAFEPAVDPTAMGLMVVRRMFRGVGDGDQGYLGPDTTPRDHHELVARQITHILETGEEAPLAPLLQAFQKLFPGVEVAETS